MSAPTLILLAPVSGVVTPLAEVPDPAFSERLAGDGVAIAPESGVLLAPCRGVISHMHGAGHALTLTTPEGLDILLHIGVDTVQLNGTGFAPLAAAGDAVEAGQPLIRFDPAFLAGHAKSALTLMLVTNTELVFSMRAASGLVQAGHSPALVLSLASAVASEADATLTQEAVSPPVALRQASGLHARPAAVLAVEARRHPAEITLSCGDRVANAKSVAALMALGVKEGDPVTVRALGPAADEAVAALAALLEQENMLPASTAHRIPEPLPDRMPETDTTDRTDETGRASASPDLLRGKPASPGITAGFVRQWRPVDPDLPEQGGSREAEEKALVAAIDAARRELDDLARKLAGQDEERAAVFMAQRGLLDDPELFEEARDCLGKGHSAAFAWREACDGQAAMLASLPDPLIAARAEDVRDIGRRVILRLTGAAEPCSELPERTILIAEELPPSVVASLDPATAPGFCTVKGSPSSHASLLARAAGIASIAAVEQRALIIADGTPVLLDANAGLLKINPDAAALEQVRKAREKAEADAKLQLLEAQRPAVTLDGARVSVTANIAGLADAEAALAGGADGVGLFRTEFLFLDQADAPPEEKQAAAYARIAKLLGPQRRLALRTLDAGGDKALPFLDLPEENNPFLGLRGYRISREFPALFAAQVRASLKAAAYCRLGLLLPFISSVEELREAKQTLRREKEALGITAPVPLGIMVEVPSTALLADNLADEADFFSIGTNDLTQYTLAADRGHPKLAGAADALHPAVLRLIAMTVESARRFRKPVGVCGDIASDPEAVPLLLGLGVDSLSVPPAAIPPIKAVVRGLDLARCRDLAADALTMLTATEVRSYLRRCKADSGA